jgi:hypothetical protein
MNKKITWISGSIPFPNTDAKMEIDENASNVRLNLDELRE